MMTETPRVPRGRSAPSVGFLLCATVAALLFCGAIAAPILAAHDAAAELTFQTAQGDGASTPKSQKKEKEKKKKKGTVRWEWTPHPTLRFGKGSHVDFRARISEQTDRSDAASVDQSSLDIARRRVGVEGEVHNAVGFQVERELGDVGVDNAWRDVFVEYRQFTFARAIYGKFKLPFSVDENTGATNLDFAYRSLAASQLAPGRDRGWMVHGQVLNHAVGYEYGEFDHDGHNAHTNSIDRVTGGPTKAWRITSQPLRSLNSRWTDLEFGYAETTSDVGPGFSSLKGSTVLGQDFYKSKYLVSGARKRTGYEFRFRPGPFSLKSEYIRVTEERLGVSVENAAASPLTSTGWYVSGTFAITGENKAAGLDEPKHPLLQGGFGAVEVAMRVEKLTFSSVASEAAPNERGSRSIRSDTVIGNGDRVTTIGVNWYANRWVKVQFNVIKEELTDPTQGPLAGQPTFSSKVLRFQIGF